MAVATATVNNGGYSMREIIDRYESEEDEFIRELEDMRKSLQSSEQEDEVPQDPAPLLSVLCSLVDEIGSLRTENRQLKTRMHTTSSNNNRPKNVVQRMSAIFDSRSILPKLRRPSTSNEVRTGARERLATPPRKDPLTASSVSTDFSNGSRDKAPPLVEPELSDSDIDENVFSEDQSTYERRGRADSRRCDMSLSECTSPSSASSSRDPSETMMSSRSSFFDLFGFRRSSVNMRAQPTALPPQPAKSALKKRKRRVTSQDDVSYTAEFRARMQQKPPRPASYFPREDSEDSDHNRARKAASFLSVSGNFNRNDSARADRETRLIHEKDGMAAEIEELKMRNQRLVEQLREKSSQFSKIQLQYNKLENQFDIMANRCTFNENIEKLCLDDRVARAIVTTHEEIDDILRSHELHVQATKAENSSNHQKAVTMCNHDRTVHQDCVEQLDKVQSDLFNLMKERLRDSQNLDSHLKRRLENLPSYESLYTFTSGVVRKITDLRWSLIEKSALTGKTEMELLSTQSSLLVTYAQLERMRALMRDTKRTKRRRRAVSYHGEDVDQRIVKPELNFYVPFKLHGTRIENMRRIRNKKNMEPMDQSPEEEFLQMFATPRDIIEQQQQRSMAPAAGATGMQRPSSRIADMMREMSTGRPYNSPREPAVQQNLKFSPVFERMTSQKQSESRRPISLVEIEADRFKRGEETRRSIKQLRKQTSIDKPLRSMVVVPPVELSRIQPPKREPRPQTRIYEMVPDVPPPLPTMPPGTPLRSRKMEKQYSTESRVEDQLSEIQRKRDELAKELEEKRLSYYRDERDARMSMLEERRPVRLQRSPHVAKMSKIKPPTQSTVQMKSRTLESPSMVQLPQMRCPPTQTMPSATNDLRPKLERSKTIDTHEAANVQMRTSISNSKLPKPNRKSWFEKFKSMKKG